MALSAKDKNNIAAGLQVLPAILPFPLNIAIIAPVQGLVADLTRIRFPRISPGQVSQEILNITRGTGGRAGAEARVTSSPFDLRQFISNRDQDEFLTELMREDAIRRLVAQQDTSRLFLQRRALIEGLAESAEERGFASVVDTDLRGGVFRATADSPLQFIQGDFLP